MGIPVVWVIMNNFAYGTIAGLQMAHYGTTIGCVFSSDGEPYSPDFAAIARAYGAEGVQIKTADEFKTVLAQRRRVRTSRSSSTSRCSTSRCRRQATGTSTTSTRPAATVSHVAGALRPARNAAIEKER